MSEYTSPTRELAHFILGQPGRRIHHIVVTDAFLEEIRRETPVRVSGFAKGFEFLGVPLIVGHNLPTNIGARFIDGRGKIIAEFRNT